VPVKVGGVPTVELRVVGDFSSVELIPAISLGIDGDDLPKLRRFVVGAGTFDSWELDRTVWMADVRAMLELPPFPALQGLIALEDIRNQRLLDSVGDYAIESAANYGWGPFMDGGLVLVVDQLSFALPTCCVDLEDGVRDWIALCEEWPSAWTGVESGHPGVLARRLGDRVQFSQQLDDLGPNISPALDVPLAALQNALVPALASIEAFALRLGDHFAARGMEDPHRFSRIVAGLSIESR
jgi:hypothetical protein